MKYELFYRPYSLLGDNCQQFVMQFCREIEVEFKGDTSNRLRTATGLANLLRSGISLLCLLFLLDIFANRGRFTLSTSLHSALALFGMIILTIAHPRVFLLNVSHFPFNVAHLISIVFNGFVCLLWVFVGIVLAFSFEKVCDEVAVRMVDGVQVFDVWHSCNIVLRVSQSLIAIVCLLGYIYHSYYGAYFIQDR